MRSLANGRPGPLRAGLALAFLSFAVPAGAATRFVDPVRAGTVGPPYYATIVEAHALSTSGDTVAVSSSGSPYVHTAVLALNDGVVYQGGYGPDFEGPNPASFETTIELQLASGDSASVVEAIGTGSETLFAGFTLTGGATFNGGGMFCGTGAPTIRDCIVRDNYASNFGGGIMIGAGSSAFIYHCELRGNQARRRGGGIMVAVNSPDARIEFCTVEACSAAVAGDPEGGGGGIYATSPVSITRTTIRDCYSGLDGGGVLARDADVQLGTNWLFDNRAARFGGGIYADGSSGRIGGCQIEGSSAGVSGGGVYFETGTWRIEGSFLRGNSAEGTGLEEGGGAMFFERSTGAVVRSNEIVNNTAQEGGGIRITGPNFRSILSVEIISNTFFGNGATNAEAGGSLHVGPTGNFADLIYNNIFSHQTDGSAVSCFGAFNQPVLRYNCVFNDGVTNRDPEYDGDCDDRTNINGNIKGDPRFCDATTSPPNLKLQFFSPCVGTGENGADMGVYPEGDCVAVQVEPMTWGRLKASWR
ncbi:MAG: hypothetical protein R3B81_17755 [bacterium]